jgi:hypothetical protein
MAAGLTPGQPDHCFLEGNADLRHRSPLRQEHVLDRPVEAAGAQSGESQLPGTISASERAKTPA